MIPFEALLPYTVMMVFLTASGAAVGTIKELETGKRPRRMLFKNNLHDQHMVQRDFRMTGVWRGQLQEAVAPERFKTLLTWQVVDERRKRWTFGGFFGGRDW